MLMDMLLGKNNQFCGHKGNFASSRQPVVDYFPIAARPILFNSFNSCLSNVFLERLSSYFQVKKVHKYICANSILLYLINDREQHK